MDKLKEADCFFDGAFSEISIDTEKKIIKNVALVGQISRNGRRYRLEALQGGVGKYEGAKIYIDHASENDEKQGWRSARDLAGKVLNPRFEGNKIRGDVHALNTDGGSLLFELATNAPEIAGMSHNAFGKYHKEDGVEVVESIDKVVSVDVVTEPATNNGFFESDNNNSKGVKTMDYKEVTMVGLKEARNDLCEQLVNEGKASRDDEFQKVIEENNKLKKELDEVKVAEALREKAALVDKALAESELPKEAKTDLFREMLLGVEVQEGEKLEEKIDELIADRMTVLTGKTVKNNTEKGGGGKTKESKEAHKDLSESEKKALARKLKS